MDIERQEEYKKFTKEEQATTAFRASRTPLESRAELPADRPELIIAGRDATAQMLAKLGKMLDFTVTIVDPLIALAEWAETDRILRVLDFSLLPAAQERYVVVASRGLFDEEAIEQALSVDATYVALLANRKRSDEVIRTLRAKAVSAEKLADVRSPAGLNIGAESPEEIALSIMAEIVAVRHKAQ